MFWRNRVAPLIQKLKSADAAERKAAAEALDKLKRLSVDECRTALEAACEAFPSFEEEFFGSGRFALYSSAETMLLSLARERVHQSFVQIIQRDFARYSPEGRAYACLILKEIDTDESWAALRELILQHGALRIADSPSLRVDNEAQARRLFPQALALLGQSSVGAFRYELAKLCLEGFEERGMIPTGGSSETNSSPHPLPPLPRRGRGGTRHAAHARDSPLPRRGRGAGGEGKKQPTPHPRRFRLT